MKELWAKYDKEEPVQPDITYYTVTFETGGGSAVPSQDIPEGETAIRPANPAKAGFIFVNWYDNDDFIDPHFDFNAPVTKDFTLYAKWDENTFPVTGVTLDQTTLSLTVGDDPVTLTAAVTPGNATDKTVSWNSSDELVATVNSGNVTAVSTVTAVNTGTAIITVTTADGGYAATCTVTVLQRPSTFTITFDQIEDEAVNLISNITVSRAGAGGVSRTASVTVADANADSNIIWYIDGNPLTDFDNNPTITIDTGDAASPFFYYPVGVHNITLELVKANKPYSKNIVFEVVP